MTIRPLHGVYQEQHIGKKGQLVSCARGLCRDCNSPCGVYRERLSIGRSGIEYKLLSGGIIWVAPMDEFELTEEHWDKRLERMK